MTESRFTPEILTRIRRIGPFDISPNQRWLVAAVDELSDDERGFDTNLYRLDLEDPSSGLHALTRDSRKKGTPRFTSDGTLGFLSQPDPNRRRGQDDDERDEDKQDSDEPGLQVHRLSVDGGAAECLTDLARGVRDFQWTPNGQGLVLLAPVHPDAEDLEHDRKLQGEWAKRKPSGVLHASYPVRYWDHFHGPAHAHLVTCRADGTELRDLTRGLRLGLDDARIDVSPDGRHVVIDLEQLDGDLRFERHLVAFDLESGERRALTDGKEQHWQASFSPDGRRIACLTHLHEKRVTGKRDVKVIDFATGEGRRVTEHLDLWPNTPHWIDDARIAFSADERGYDLVRVLNVDGGDAGKVLTEVGNAEGLLPSPDGERLYFVMDRIDAAPELHVTGVSGGDVTPVTTCNAELLNGMPLASGRSETVTGDEGVDIQLWEVRPPDFDESRKYPLLLWIHGGPLGAFTDEMHFRWNPQVYAALGHVVIMVNPRGSTGFGQSFIEGNNGDWGGRCFRDLMRATDAWAAKPYVDETRMAALGASFGGYMVNWIAAHEDRFRCLVSHAGLFQLPTFWGTTDCGPEWELEFGETPWGEPELYEKWSPHAHAGNFKTPTLVIHGELDYRVPLGEGLQMFQALQKQGVPSKLLYFPDENHWILKPPNMRLWNETVIDWLAEYLKPDGDSGS